LDYGQRFCLDGWSNVPGQNTTDNGKNKSDEIEKPPTPIFPRHQRQREQDAKRT